MKSLILAGGSGTRLWPLSRKNYPKQFLKLNSDKSLLQQTASRLKDIFSPQDIVVMTNSEYKFHVMSDLKELFGGDSGNIILEPAARNTAPAIALGMKFCLEKLGCANDDVLFVSPADHIISPPDKFADYVRMAAEIAEKGRIVTFGIKPNRPETGYGYIQAGEEEEPLAGYRTAYYKAVKFTEKPDAETAKRYVAGGNYYWNSGMFAFTIGTMLEEFATHSPEIRSMLEMDLAGMTAEFHRMPKISIDYAVAERSDKISVLPLDLYWNDIGSWDSLYEIATKDEKGNVGVGDIISIDTKDTLILTNRRLVSTIGLEDCLIVDADDAVLIAKKGEAQKVREVVDRLSIAGRREAAEHVTTHRPWGSYTILEEGDRYKIKRIVVNPGATLSLQMHYHRSEHWVVVKGAAKVKIGEKDVIVHENESVYVPKSTLHRLENPGRVPLEIIEVQNGEYVGEDDIVRVDDVYGRTSNISEH